MIKVQEMDTTPTTGLWQLPEGWEWVYLGDAFSLRSGNHDPSRTPDEIFSLYSMPSYDAGAGPEIVSGREIGSSKIVVQKGDILLSKLNPRIPRIWYINEDNARRKLASTDFLSLVVRQNSNGEPYFDTIFARYLLLSNIFRSQVSREIKGATNSRQRLNREDVLSALLPRPRSLDIQHRIVARIEALLADLREAQETLASMQQDIDQVMDSALLEVFGHTRDGFKVVNIPSDEVKQLNSVAKVERGKFTHRPRNDPRFFGGVIPWIQIQNLPSDYSKYITDYMNTLNDLGLSVSKLFPRGTLVLSIAATIGAVGILTFDACFPDSLVGITPNSDYLDPGFLYWQLAFIREYLEKIAPSAAQKNINLRILNQIELWVPSMTEQKLINAHLDAIQEGISHLQDMTKEDEEILQWVEQGILNQAFRGKL